MKMVTKKTETQISKLRTTLRTIAESPQQKPPIKKLLWGAFGYCLLTDA